MKLISVDKESPSIKFVKDMNDKIKIDALKDAIITYNKGELSKEALQAVAKDAGRKVNIWDKATKRHPQYPTGQENSRVGFSYDPKHPKGKFFERFIKKTIWKTIEFVHRKMLKYDENIFVFDDQRLGGLHDFLFAYIDSHGSHSIIRASLYKKAVEIVLGMSKEDLRYRALLFHCYNEIHVAFRRFELTPAEKDNIKRWR
jgi:hypothetical protein